MTTTNPSCLDIEPLVGPVVLSTVSHSHTAGDAIPFQNKMATSSSEMAPMIQMNFARFHNVNSSIGIPGFDKDMKAQSRALNQVQYYFGDANLPYDRFMWTHHTASPEHWVPIATIASFPRMLQFQSRGIPWLADALRKSCSLLGVDETGTKVRRQTAVKHNAFTRSVYAEGFGKETPSLHHELRQFFSQYGKVNAILMRRRGGKTKQKFKGSVFCQFAEYKDANMFLAADHKPQWDGKGLLIMFKYAYCKMKIEQRALRVKSSKRKTGTGLRGRDDFNAFKEMEIALDVSSVINAGPQQKPKTVLEEGRKEGRARGDQCAWERKEEALK